MSDAAEEQCRLTRLLSEAKRPRHVIRFLYSPTCPHCRRVMPLLEEYVSRRSDTALMKVDATTEEGTSLLYSILKTDLPVVPLAVVDDRFIVASETMFIERVSYAIQLSERMPEPAEARRRWMLQA